MIPVWDDLTHVERLDGKAGMAKLDPGFISSWPTLQAKTDRN